MKKHTTFPFFKSFLRAQAVLTLLLCGSLALQAQWLQLGLDIDGEGAGDESGTSVSLSADGSTVAIGAPLNMDGGPWRGHVRVYKYTAGVWAQQGADIDGEADNDYSGSSVSLSADGNTVAIGAPGNDGDGLDRGHVRVYKYTAGVWAQQGADIDGEADNDGSGTSVSLSADGGTVAIGARTNDGGGPDRGHVRVYKNTGGTWAQQGADIDGEADGDVLGWSVSLSADGATVAIGAPGNDGGGPDRGHVRVYKYAGGVWAQQGADIDGEADNDRSGHSVSLSADGNTVAIGAPFNAGGGGPWRGHARVYKNIGGVWAQQGADIDGEANGDLSGISVSLSADGATVAIGAPGNYNGPNSRGRIRVYKYTGGVWAQQGADIHGEASLDFLGLSVSLSADGATVAVGAPGTYGIANPIPGYARVYACSLTPFAVTGGGIRCGGGTVAVGLAGSQVGAKYQLVRNSAAGPANVGAPVDGTGSAIAFPPQNTPGTYTVTASCGGTANMTGSAIVAADAQKPTVTCPPNQIKPTDAGLCAALVAYPLPTISDNCGVSGNYGLDHLSGGLSNSAFQKGITVVTWMGTDGSNNTKTCTFRVIVNDLEAPTLNCPTPAPINAAAGLCTATYTYAIPMFADNCPPTSGTSVRVSGPASGSAFPVGNTKVTFQATDAAGNTKRCTMTVAVVDDQPPVITCPPPVAVAGSGSPCVATVFYASPTATDNCAGTLTPFLFSGLASGSSFPAGVTTNTWQAIAPNGQTTECSFGVTVTCGVPKGNGAEDRIAVAFKTQSPKLKTYPNPAAEEAWLDLSALEGLPCSVCLLDARRALVRQYPTAQTTAAGLFRLDLDGLPAGLYFVQVRAQGKAAQVLKLAVERR